MDEPVSKTFPALPSALHEVRKFVREEAEDAGLASATVNDVVLELGGTLVLSTPNRETFSPNGVLNPFHSHEYTASELTDLLRRSFANVEVLGVRHGLYLRSLDVLAEGSLQHLLMRTPYDDLAGKVRTGVDLVRADHFALGSAEGAHDLFAVATA